MPQFVQHYLSYLCSVVSGLCLAISQNYPPRRPQVAAPARALTDMYRTPSTPGTADGTPPEQLSADQAAADWSRGYLQGTLHGMNLGLCQPQTLPMAYGAAPPPPAPGYPPAAGTPVTAPTPYPAPATSDQLNSETESNHDTALTLACAGGHEELVQLLIKRGAQIGEQGRLMVVADGFGSFTFLRLSINALFSKAR